MTAPRDVQFVRPELKSPLVIVAHTCPDHAKRRNVVNQLGDRTLKVLENNRISIITRIITLIHNNAT